MIIRSMMGDGGTRTVDPPSFILDRTWLVEVKGNGQAWTARVDGRGERRSNFLIHANLPAALAELGWEIC